VRLDHIIMSSSLEERGQIFSSVPQQLERVDCIGKQLIDFEYRVFV
jgi:hypothetical protein